MTNAEKYKEIFGLEPEIESCPVYDCIHCPMYNDKPGEYYCRKNTGQNWWDGEYKGGDEK